MRHVHRDYDWAGKTLGVGDTVEIKVDGQRVNGVIVREIVLEASEISPEDMEYPFQYGGWENDSFLFYEIMLDNERVRRFGGDVALIEKASRQRRLF